MTVLALVVLSWLALSAAGGLLFSAFVRGSGGTDAPVYPVESPAAVAGARQLTLPVPRIDLDAAIGERVG